MVTLMEFKKGFLFTFGAIFMLVALLWAIGPTIANNASDLQQNAIAPTPGGVTYSTPDTSGQNLNTITVSGDGIAYVTPDVAKITIGVVVQSDTAAGAMSANAVKMNAVINALKSKGINDNDILRSTVSVNPNYNYVYNGVVVPMAADGVSSGTASTVTPVSSGPAISNVVTATPDATSASLPMIPSPNKGNNIIGYTATNQVTVTIRDVSTIGSVIDTAYDSGANAINGVSYTLSDHLYNTVYGQALTSANSQGKYKASVLASANDISSYKLKSVSEGSSYVPIYAGTIMAGADASMAPSVISPGQQQVNAHVTMVYVF